MKTYNILDLITPQSIANYKLSFHIDEEGNVDETGATEVVIFTGNQFFVEVRARFNHMLFDAMTAKDTNTEATNLNNAKVELGDLFESWADLNRYNYGRAYMALKELYKPLENYYREELGGETLAKHKGSISETSTDITQTPTTKTKTSEKVNAYDGGSVDSTEVTTEYLSGNNHTTGNAQGNYTRTKDIDEQTYDKDVQTYNDRVTRGNIGVTSSQDMLEQELAVRAKSFAEDLIEQFCKMFLYAVEGVG